MSMTNQFLPRGGGEPAKLVEGHPRFGAPYPHVPLHHPADGPPPLAGEEL